MKTKKILKNIQSEINDVNHMISGFEKTKSIPSIELDLCLEKLRKVYDNLSKIKNTTILLTNTEEVSSTFIETEKENKEEPVITTQKTEPEIILPEKELIISPIEKEDKIESDEPNKNTVLIIENKEEEEEEFVNIEPIIEKKPVQETPQPIIKTVKEKKINTESKILGDKINSQKRSLNDIISQNKLDKDLSSQYKSKKITDLNKAINLNDKIWFTKELFEGDNNKLKSTLNSLNQSEDLDEAINFITDNYNWDSESRIVQKFLTIISRRFQ